MLILIIAIISFVCIISVAIGITITKNIEINNLIEDYENDLYVLNTQIDYLTEDKNYFKDQYNEAKIELNNLTSEIEYYRNGSRYELHDPTYHEVKNFIKRDSTDKIRYDEETFNCLDYSTELNNNADEEGIRCCVVELGLKDIAHALVGFNTTDRGMVYVEPQSDEWVEDLVIGNDYWTDCLIPKAGYYYENDPGDTIERILIYW